MCNLDNNFKIVRLASPGEVKYASSDDEIDLKNAHKDYIKNIVRVGSLANYGRMFPKPNPVKIMVREMAFLVDGQYYSVLYTSNDELISPIIFYYKNNDLEPLTIDEYIDQLKHPKIIKLKRK